MSKIILGTVQFGLNYGINNSSGKPSEREVFEILDTAVSNKIECLDTADAYGNAMEIIGQYHRSKNSRFKILSKFKGVKRGELARLAEGSLEKLGIEQYEVYSYHSFDDYIQNPFIQDELVSLKVNGKVKRIGISVYTNNALEKIIENNLIDVIQIPHNILDNMNVRGALIKQAKAKGKEVHVRSVFLQGLFFMDVDRLPEKLLPLKKYLVSIGEFCQGNNLSVLELCLNYALWNEYIDKVVLGVENQKQLQQIISSYDSSLKGLVDAFVDTLSVNESELLNPVNWK